MKNVLALFIILATGCAKISTPPVNSEVDADRDFARLAEQFIAGYLNWRPQIGTSLGFHEYDGKLTDFSRASLEAELNRLKQFDQALASFNKRSLGAQSSYDLRLLQ